MKRVTESDSLYNDLELMDTDTIIQSINTLDQTVAIAVNNELASIGKCVDAIHHALSNGGRLFYIGAGTSGRLGVLDASECPPTFGVDHGVVIGIIAGGDSAIRVAVEHAEDDRSLAWEDLKSYNITDKDIVIGIAASGTTPYVIGGLVTCQSQGIATGCVTCNTGSPVSAVADYPICVAVGPEFVTGSTRMKSGTAQKMVLNMLTTATMIKLGKVKGNKMFDMKLSNDKLVDRGTNMVMSETNLDYDKAKALLLEHGSVRAAVVAYNL